MVLSSSQLMGLSMLGVGILVSTTGYISPFWEYHVSLESMDADIEVDVGLIFACMKITGFPADPDGDIEDCKTLPWDLTVSDDIYFKAVRVLMAGSLILMYISGVISIATCCNRHTATSVFFEAVLAFLGGITGVAGVATFAAFSDGNYRPTQVGDDRDDWDVEKGWSFFLSCTGAAFVTITSTLTMCAPRRQQKFVESTIKGGISNPGYGMKNSIKSAPKYS